MSSPTIKVLKNGPYELRGEARIVRRRITADGDGHPTGWEDVAEIATPGAGDDPVYLCRCGQSKDKPFCDGSHQDAGFDGTEKADTRGFDDLAELDSDHGITLGDAEPFCSHTGFCANANSNVWAMVHENLDEAGRAEHRAMIERCPSGRLAHRAEGETAWHEPDLPCEVVAVVDGQLMVTGGVALTRADGAAMATRNRVSLCRCGESGNKPLCDGCHAQIGFRDEPATSTS